MLRHCLTLTALMLWASLASAAPSITLLWTYTSTATVTGYQIQRCSGSAACTPVDLPGATTSAKSYTDRTVVLGQLYCYAVVAVNGSLRSDPSNVGCGVDYTDPAADPATSRSLAQKLTIPTTTPAP